MAGATLFDGVKVASSITDRVLVFYSGGKDSAVVLDMACRYFRHVTPVFMYLVPGLSFQEAQIKWAEQRYGREVMRVPHFMLSEWLRYGTFRQADLECPMVSIKNIYTYCRAKTDTWWVAAGERIADSIVRRAMIKSSGGTVDDKRGRFYPVAEWTKPEVMSYIAHHKIKVSPESRVLGFSFRSLMPGDMAAVKHHYPEDYERIRAWFPMVETAVKQWEFFHAEAE